MTGNNGSASPGAEDPRLEDQDIAGTAGNPIPHLDGNAAAGPLWELFRIDIIAAIGRCKNCGAVRVFGEAAVYADAPGIVVRCSSCGGVLLRLVETPTKFGSMSADSATFRSTGSARAYPLKAPKNRLDVAGAAPAAADDALPGLSPPASGGARPGRRRIGTRWRVDTIGSTQPPLRNHQEQPWPRSATVAR